MKTTIKILIISITSLIICNSINAQIYNKCAGQNEVYAPVTGESVDDVDLYIEEEDEEGRSLWRKATEKDDKSKAYVKVDSDQHGNADGNQYDLAVDGAFAGQTIAIIHLYPFEFGPPKTALEEKGFSVYRWIGRPPSPEELEQALDKSCQLWIISNSTRMLTEEHIAIIKEYFEDGHGVYIWGDNDPYYADANAVAEALFGVSMQGNLWGDKTVGLKKYDNDKSGLLPNHLISTGLEYVYEGITIATIEDNDDFEPLIYGSAGNLVTAVYEKDGKRAIIDGGFTRLYCAWDNAGTGRYVKNAAAWLANYEKFNDELLKTEENTDLEQNEEKGDWE